MTLGQAELEKLTTTIKLLEDGRLVGAESAIDVRKDDRLSAILSAAAFAVSAALPLVAVAGPAGGAAAAGLAVIAGASTALGTGPRLALLREYDATGVREIEELGQILEESVDVRVPRSHCHLKRLGSSRASRRSRSATTTFSTAIASRS